ncbi:replication protein A 70 kDa DNA-binding subunit C-like protein [Tanacetum coccineum]
MFKPCITESKHNMATEAVINNTELFLDELYVGVSGTIVVMVCRMWDVNVVTGCYLSTDFVVSDVKPNKDEFGIIENDTFMLEFEGATTVRKAFVKYDGFVKYPFQQVDVDNLDTNNKYLIGKLVCLLCIRYFVPRFTAKGQSVRVTLWGGLGDVLIEKRTRHVGLYLIVLTTVTAKHYNNRLYLSSSSSTLILDDDEILAVKELKLENSGVELNKESLSAKPKDGTLENLLMWVRNRKNNGWKYPSCGGDKCKKGITRKDEKFCCDSCNKPVEYPVLRFRLELEVSNEIAEVVVVMFDETATNLVKCSTNSILEAEDESTEENLDLPRAISNVIGTTLILELKSHAYYEHETFESFTYWKINPTETVEESAGSSTLDTVADTRAPLLKRLARHPSVSIPANPSKEKKHKRLDLKDSDTEVTCVADEQAKDGNAGCPSDKKKKKSYAPFGDRCLQSNPLSKLQMIMQNE